MKENFNPDIQLEGILMSMYDSRLRLANLVVDKVKEIFGEQVYDTIIHRNARIGEAPNMHMPIVLINASSRGAVNFLNLAQEFLRKNNVVLV